MDWAIVHSFNLRDYFAASALALMPGTSDYPDAEKVAEHAYKVADAMLAIKNRARVP